MSFEKVPESLRTIPQWICYEIKQGNDGKKKKIPRSPKGGYGKSNDPSTWTSFSEAVEACKKHHWFAGIGFVFNKSGIVGIDLDHVIKNGNLEAWAQTIVNKLDSYTEYSPSGEGLHIFVKANLPCDGKKRVIDDPSGQAIEMYDKGRYFTVTGKVYRDVPIAERQREINEIFNSMFPPKKNDPQVNVPVRLYAPEYLRQGLRNDKKLCALWDGHRSTNDESRNDMALMNKLAYWCNKNIDQMIEAFRASPYAAQKDEEHQKKIQRDDYMKVTAQKAIEECRSTAAQDDEVFQRERVKEAFAPKVGKEIHPSDYTDAGNAAVFSEYFKGELLFSDALGWLRWNGKKWDNSDHHATACALEFSAVMLNEARSAYIEAVAKEAELKAARAGESVALLDEAGETPENDELAKATKDAKSAKAYFAWAQKTRSKPRIDAMVALSKPKLVIAAEKLDPNPFDLNTPAGIIDLKTGLLRSHDSAAHCTKITRYSRGNKGAERWNSFLQQITDGDIEYQQYLQQLFGLAAIGKVYEESLYIPYGDGSNGKSTLTNSIHGAMGDYAGSICVDILTTVQQNRGASLATLRGKRLVTAGELEEHQRLSAAMLKRITSTDKITIEMKYKAPEDIIPTHTLVLSTNHLPHVGSRDQGTWRRIRVLPFTHIFPKAKGILNYADVLEQKSGESIIAWVVEGARQVIAQDFKIGIPMCIAKATQKYQQEEDWLRNFLNECCDLSDPNERTQASVLYKHYQEWARGMNEYVRRQSDFSQALEAEGFKSVSPGHRKYYLGIKAINAGYAPQYGHAL